MTDLTGGINDVALILGTHVLDVLGEGALNGRIIGFDEVVLDELDDQR